MLVSFATTASSNNNYGILLNPNKLLAYFFFYFYIHNFSNRIVRPEITIDGPLAIKKGRHPLREIVLGREYVPTDVFIDAERSV